MKTKFTISVLSLISIAAALAGCGHQHTFSNDWSSNNVQHWHQATCEHNLAINIENHLDSNNDGYCDVCNWNMGGEHTHTFSTSWSSNNNEHWHAATCGHDVISESGEHIDNNNDKYCDVCNWNMSGAHTHNFSTTWSFDSVQHWHECSCSAKTDIAVHVDNNGDNYCDFCGYDIGGPVPHTHTFSNAWTTNSSQHWHAATCGHNVTSEQGNHIDSDKNGYCDVCNYYMGGPDPSDYYSSITSDLTGTSLLSALQSLNSSKRKRTVSYAGMKTFAPICDANPDNPNRMVGFYNNKDLPNYWDNQATWNREHVWPKSLGGDKVEGDAFMPRPCDVDINGGRGNKVYSKTAYDPGCEGYANYRGICARIIFYCVVACPSLRIVDNDSGDGSSMGKLSDLLEWNLAYLPSKSETAALELKVEQNRNNVIETHKNGQGNRNPFIDHPEYACKIWGTTNAATRKACGL